MPVSTPPSPPTACRTEVRHPREGLSLTYRLTLCGDRRLVEITAEDGRGTRRESVGGFPSAASAERFFDLLLRGEVTPYTLVELYDEFMALTP